MTAATSRSIPASSSTTSSTIPTSRRCFRISASRRTQATWAFRCRSTAAVSNGAAPTVRSIFAQKRNFFSPSFLWMLREILRFNRQCVEDRDAGQLAHRSIGEYLEHRKFSPKLSRQLPDPDGGSDLVDAAHQDARLSGRRLRLVLREPPPRSTMSGRPGGRSPAARAAIWRNCSQPLGRRVRLGAPVNTIIRDAFGVTIWAGDAAPQRFDHVDHRRAQRPGAGDARRPLAGRAKHPVGDRLPAEPRRAASRSQR